MKTENKKLGYEEEEEDDNFIMDRIINLNDHNNMNIPTIRWRENSQLRLLLEKAKQEIFNNVIGSIGDIKNYGKYVSKVDKLLEDCAIYFELNQFPSKAHIKEYAEGELWYEVNLMDKLYEVINIDDDIRDDFTDSFLFRKIDSHSLLEIYSIITRNIFDKASAYTPKLNDLFMDKASADVLYKKINMLITYKYVVNQLVLISDDIMSKFKAAEEKQSEAEKELLS